MHAIDTGTGPRVFARRITSWFIFHPKTAVAIFYAIVALLANFPVFPGDTTHLNSYTSYDIVQTTWFLAYTPYALLHGHNLFYTDLINNPVGVNLSQNTGMPLLGLITAPVTLLASPVASLNLLRWLAFTLSAYSAYWVFRRVTSWNFAAFVGGLLYGFSPYMVTQGSLHLNLTFVPLPPLIFYVLFELFVLRQRTPRHYGLMLGWLIVAQYFISAEILATTAIVAIIAVVLLAISRPREILGHLGFLAKALPFTLLLIALFLGYPIWYLQHGLAHYTGPAQGFYNPFNADLLGPVVPTLAQIVAPRHLAEIGSHFVAGPGDLSENGSYIGIPLTLASLYMVVRFWRRRWPIYLGLVTLATFVLSLGPRLIIDGRIHPLPFPLPFAKINHLPLVENLLPVRFSLYVVFFIAALLVYGLEQIHQERVADGNSGIFVRARGANDIAHQLLGWVIALACVITLLPNFPYHAYRLRLNWSESPKGLAIIPTGDRVLTYPYPSVFADTPMLWQALSGMRFNLLGGYALIPSATGSASLIPATNNPVDVQAMLEDSVSPVPPPGVLDRYATAVAYAANTVSLVSGRSHFHQAMNTQRISATIYSVDPTANTMIVWVKRLNPVTIDITPTTTFNLGSRTRVGLLGLRPLDHVVITGTENQGTINAVSVAHLRTYILANRVNDVVVDLGLLDSGEIARWFRLALGPPTRAGAGGEIWLNAEAKAAAYGGQP